MMKRLMLAAVLAFGQGGTVRGEITGVPVWDLARDAGELSERLGREGFLPLDSAHGFEISSDAVRDLRAFTVEMEVRATKDVQRRQISLLDQMSEGAGWSLGNVRWNVAGNNLLLGLNGTSFAADGCVIPTNRACSIVLTVREGLVRVYFDGRQVTRFFSEIKPNGAPIRIGNTKLRKRGALKEMSGLQLLSLRFWGADTDYLADGETRGWADADRGGPVPLHVQPLAVVRAVPDRELHEAELLHRRRREVERHGRRRAERIRLLGEDEVLEGERDVVVRRLHRHGRLVRGDLEPDDQPVALAADAIGRIGRPPMGIDELDLVVKRTRLCH